MVLISSNTLSEKDSIETFQGQRSFVVIGFLRVTETETRKRQCVFSYCLHTAGDHMSPSNFHIRVLCMLLKDIHLQFKVIEDLSLLHLHC